MAHKISVNLNVFSGTPLYEQVAREIQKAVERGHLAFDERLPSIRELSAQLQISATTTRDALELLEKRGLIRCRQGSGNYVCADIRSEDKSPQSQFEPPSFVERPFEAKRYGLDQSFPWSSEASNLNCSFNTTSFHPFWDSRLAFDFRVYQPIHYDLEQSRLPKMLLQMKRTTALGSATTGDSQGSIVLRRELARWLNKTRRLDLSVEDLFITSGAQQARDLVARILINDGDRVVVEEPGSITDLLAYSAKGARLTHVRLDLEGIDLAMLGQAEKPKVIHLIGPGNFPAATAMSLQRRLSVLEWAALNDVVIVEDSYGAGFYHNTPVLPSLFSLAKTRAHLATVIYTGSLSQFINPACRLGFVVLPRHFQKEWLQLRWLADRRTSSLSQQVLINSFASGHFEEHAMRVSQAARKRRAVMLAALSEWPRNLINFTPVDTGIHQPIWFERPIDDLAIFESAMKAGIGVVPLSPYFHTAQKASGLSLGFMQMNEGKIIEGLKELLKLIMANA
jgi:GntR family transcriptional regulator/MocR family aminotransferase